jgi:hypothetical protein
MKKILSLFMALAFLTTGSFAQAAKTQKPTKTKKETTTTKQVHTKKDGSADMSYKDNKMQ